MKRTPRLVQCAVSVLSLVVSVGPIVAPRLAFAQARPASSAQPSSQSQGQPTASPANDSARVDVSAEDQAKAQQHFQRAKELYQTGAYRDAIAELELARSLDPQAKDLVFNLGIVHERLQKYDEAIAFFRQYMEMASVTPAERTKAETIIKRIEGAKRENPVTEAPAAASTPIAPLPAPIDDPAHGRVDAATITAASVAVVGLGIGTAFGIRALSLDTSNFVTGRDGTYDELRKRTDDAHDAAIVADIGFGVGIAAAAVAAYLYFGRTKESGARRTATSGVAPSAAALPGGGGLTVKGWF
jgi:tetratricopeptide (TPR) repeat protein